MSATYSSIDSNVTSKAGTSSTVNMTIKDINNVALPNIDLSKFQITATGGSLKGSAGNGSLQNDGSGKYSFIVNNTGGMAGDAVFTVVVDGVTIGTVTHTITAS